MIKGAMDGPAFATHLRDVLAQELTPGTVIILDNLATHCNVEAAEAIREANCWFLYLPPCSPDLIPIEQAISKLKAHLCRIGARTLDDLFQPIGDIRNMFSAEECQDYFHAAGDVSG